MVNGFDRLGHDAVVGGHDENDDVRHLGAARPHGREGFMARRIQKCDLLPVDRNSIGTDVLRDSACFALGHLRLPDRIQERRFPVIDMAHNGDDRRPGLQALIALTRLHHGLQKFVPGLFDGDLDLDAGFFGNHRGRIHIHRLIEGEHLPHLHQLSHNVSRTLPDQLGEFLDGRPQRNLDALSPRLGNLRRRAMMEMPGPIVAALYGRDGAKILPAGGIFTMLHIRLFLGPTGLFGFFELFLKPFRFNCLQRQALLFRRKRFRCHRHPRRNSRRLRNDGFDRRGRRRLRENSSDFR